MFSFLFHTTYVQLFISYQTRKKKVYHKITHEMYLQIFIYMILIDNLFL